MKVKIEYSKHQLDVFKESQVQDRDLGINQIKSLFIEQIRIDAARLFIVNGLKIPEPELSDVEDYFYFNKLEEKIKPKINIIYDKVELYNLISGDSIKDFKVVIKL